MMKKIKWLIGQLKQPRILLLTIVLLGAAGVCMLMIMSTVSARPSFCVSCHNMKPEYESYTNGNLLAKKHADAGVTCHDCHEPSMLQQMDEGFKFVTGDYQETTPRYGFTNEQCLKCHDFNDVKQATASYGASNPHDSTHAEGNEPPQCEDCHSVHHQQSTRKCNTCHDTDWDVDDSWSK